MSKKWIETGRRETFETSTENNIVSVIDEFQYIVEKYELTKYNHRIDVISYNDYSDTIEIIFLRLETDEEEQERINKKKAEAINLWVRGR